MTTTTTKAAAAVAAAGLLATAPGLATSAAAERPGEQVRFTASCQMSVREALLWRATSTLDVTFRGTVQTDKSVLIYGVDYRFGPLEHYFLSSSGWSHTSSQTPGNRNNLDFEWPSKAKSADNLTPSGYWDVPNFSAKRGTNLKIRGTADHVHAPDPSCVASTSASWSTK